MALLCKECNIELRSIGTKVINNEYITRKRVCPKCHTAIKTIEIKEDAYNETFGFVNSLTDFLKRAMRENKAEQASYRFFFSVCTYMKTVTTYHEKCIPLRGFTIYREIKRIRRENVSEILSYGENGRRFMYT